jgi:hypothetical protein
MPDELKPQEEQRHESPEPEEPKYEVGWFRSFLAMFLLASMIYGVFTVLSAIGHWIQHLVEGINYVP